MHRIRNHSLNYQLKKQENDISNENERLLSRLLFISKKRKSEYSQAWSPPKMITYQNPARKMYRCVD
jgi:hypothetical protein